MAGSAYIPQFAIRDPNISDSPRHSAVVRVTHWINTLSFLGLLISGIAILLAHPRLYWGETGSVETPSLIDLPLPFILVGQNGWGRYLHFLSAWVCVLNGLLYAISGLATQHFHKNLLPTKSTLNRKSVSRYLRLARPAGEEFLSYNVLQRL